MKTSLRRIFSPIVLLLLFAALGTVGSSTVSAAPILRIDTTHKVFDSTKVRILTTAYDTIRLSNAGTGLLTVDSVRIYGSSATAYTVLHKPDTAVAAGKTDYIAVSFHPTTTGLYHDSLVVFSNGGTANRSLNGIGVSPNISFSTNLIDFDSVRVGSQTCRPIEITNTGTDTLAILANYLTVTSSNYYYLGLTGRDSLIAPGATKPIGICFTPTSAGIHNTLIAVKPNIPNDTATRYLTVTGIGVQVSGLTPTTLRMTSAIVGQSTCTTDTLRSGGGSNNLYVTSVKVTGADSSAVTLTLPSLPDTLRPDSLFIFTLCVNPTHRGTLNASVVVNYSTLGLQESATIPLNINGLIVCATATPLTAFAGHTLLGTTDTARVTVTNCGDVPTTYTAAIAGSSAYHIFGSNTSATVQPNGSTTFTVLYTPLTTSVDTGRLIVTGGTGLTPLNVALLGSGGILAITALDTVPDVPVGTCKDFTVRLHNTGNMTWTSGLAQVIGANAGDFTVVNATSVTIAPDSTRSITVRFCPKSVATETAALTFPGAAPNVSTQIALIGRGVINGVEDNAAASLALTSVYPNPSATSAVVTFNLPTAADIRIELVDARGSLIKLVSNGHETNGAHEVSVDTKSLANGTYFILLTANGKQMVKQLTVLH